MYKDKILDIIHFGYPLREGEQFFSFDPQALNEPFSYKHLKKTLLSECEKLLDGKQEVILPLSGGLDSRLILSLLLELLPAKNIHAFNYGTDGQLDFDIPPIIANKTGINFEQVNYKNISISPDQIINQHYSIDTAPTHNLVGFHVTKEASIQALRKLAVDPSMDVWSGFLGDRVFSGMWSDSNLNLESACDQFSSSYANNARSIFPSGYNPANKLFSLYKSKARIDQITWSEQLELEQRQSRVRASLQVLNNDYKFLFEQPSILTSLFNAPSDLRKNSKLQKTFCLKYYSEIFKLPVTSNFGYPLRKYSFQEKLDRYQRLAYSKIDSRFNTHLEPFKRIKMTSQRLKGLINGYDQVLEEGYRKAQIKLRELDMKISNEELERMKKNRSKSEMIASLGYFI
jgi:hypothetical protein